MLVAGLGAACGDEAPDRPTVAGFSRLVADTPARQCPVAWLPGRASRVEVERPGRAPADSVVAQLGGRMVTCAWRRAGGTTRVYAVATSQQGGAVAGLGALVTRLAPGRLDTAGLGDFLNRTAAAPYGRWTPAPGTGVRATRLRIDGKGQVVLAVSGRAVGPALLRRIISRSDWE